MFVCECVKYKVNNFFLECNCGKNFGCKISGFPTVKICHCPTGYSEKSGTCKGK